MTVLRKTKIALILALLACAPTAAPAQSQEQLKPHLGIIAKLAEDKTRKNGVSLAVQGGWYRMLGPDPDSAARISAGMKPDTEPGRRVSVRLFTKATDLYGSFAGVIVDYDETAYRGVAIGSDGRAHIVILKDDSARSLWIADTHPRLDGTDRLEVRHLTSLAQVFLNGTLITEVAINPTGKRAYGIFHAGKGLSGFTEFEMEATASTSHSTQ